MSDARREQPSRAAKAGPNYLKWIGIVVLFVLAFAGGWYYKKHKVVDAEPTGRPIRSGEYDAFAKCLASKQAKMYGLYWCPHCADQKAMFGDSFQYVPYVECAIKGVPHELAPECKAAGAKLFPSWQFGTDPPKEGVLSLQQLSEKTGCSLP